MTDFPFDQAPDMPLAQDWLEEWRDMLAKRNPDVKRVPPDVLLVVVGEALRLWDQVDHPDDSKLTKTRLLLMQSRLTADVERGHRLVNEASCEKLELVLAEVLRMREIVPQTPVRSITDIVMAVDADRERTDPVVSQIRLENIEPVMRIMQSAGALLRAVEDNIGSSADDIALSSGPAEWEEVADAAKRLRLTFDAYLPGWDSELDAGLDQN